MNHFFNILFYYFVLFTVKFVARVAGQPVKIFRTASSEWEIPNFDALPLDACCHSIHVSHRLYKNQHVTVHEFRILCPRRRQKSFFILVCVVAVKWMGAYFESTWHDKRVCPTISEVKNVNAKAKNFGWNSFTWNHVCAFALKSKLQFYYWMSIELAAFTSKCEFGADEARTKQRKIHE